MIHSVESYWMSVVTSGETLITLVTEFFPPGTTVHATIGLSEVNTVWFGLDGSGPKFVAMGLVRSWTTYNADGTESPETGGGITLNSIEVRNCARIWFELFGEFVAATAQVNLFDLSGVGEVRRRERVTRVAFDQRDGRILGVHYGGAGEGEARRAVLRRSEQRVAERQVGELVVGADALEPGMRYRVDVGSGRLVVEESGVGFGFGAALRVE